MKETFKAFEFIIFLCLTESMLSASPNSKIKPTHLRNIEESNLTKLEYFEVDGYCIENVPNILREGNIDIIPSVLLNPKDKEGNFPSELMNYSLNDLDELFILTHSNNGTFYYQIGIIYSQKKLVINLETKIPGEIHIKSHYFKNDVTYIIRVNNTLLDPINSAVGIDEKSLQYGQNAIIKIFPRNKYGNEMSFIDESDIEKLQVSITLKNKTLIIDDKGTFNPGEKVIIFNPIINFYGEALIEVKYEDTNIPCFNCDIKIQYLALDLHKSVVKFSETIILGEISNIILYPKDKYGNALPVKTIFETIEINCIFENKTFEVISKENEEDNTIQAYNKEVIKKPGDIMWYIIYNKDMIIYNVSIHAEAEIKNLKLNLFTNSLNEKIREINENNTNIILDIKSDFILSYELVDLFYNPLKNKDSANISEVCMFGYDITPINLHISREGNIFNITIPLDKKQDFNDLVPGNNYKLIIKVEKNNKIAFFYFPVTLICTEDDTIYQQEEKEEEKVEEKKEREKEIAEAEENEIEKDEKDIGEEKEKESEKEEEEEDIELEEIDINKFEVYYLNMSEDTFNDQNIPTGENITFIVQAYDKYKNKIKNTFLSAELFSIQIESDIE